MFTVTLVSPCYNTASYIHRLLDSVLSQTYGSIEMIVVDDGSTDDSSEVVRSYIQRFRSRGYTLTLLHQKNSGQAAAICNALPLVNGKYLAWPDSDDFYATEDAIERMVKALNEAGPEFAVVRTQKRKLDALNGQTLEIQGLNVKTEETKNLFLDCLGDRNGWYFCAGAYMVDFDVFKRLTGLRMFHAKGAGQNWQMLLPILYHYRCVSISEPLYNVVLRPDSHSRSRISIPGRIRRNSLYFRLLISTIWRIDGMPVREKTEHTLYICRKFGFVCTTATLIKKRLFG